MERTAIVHEWISARAGSELVFEELGKTFPEADLFALTIEPEVKLDFGSRAVGTTVLDRAFFRRHRSVSLPLMPLAWRMISRQPYERVISSSHAFAREFVKQSDVHHYSYVHAPMRYAWNPELDGRGRSLGMPGRIGAAALRYIDRRNVSAVESFAANSNAVADRISACYDRPSHVIHPPVDTEYFGEVDPAPRRDFVLTASRWIPYKRLDLAIEAAAIAGIDLVVAGSGPEESRLRGLATQLHPGRVRFHVSPSRAELRQLMADARAFVFPAHEDFGIIAVEAQAAGTAVVGFGRGGSLDTVLDRKTGVLTPLQTGRAFGVALEECLALSDVDQACRGWAAGFSRSRFRQEIRDWAAY